MRRAYLLIVPVLTVAVFLPTGRFLQADEASAKAKLAAKGIRVTHSSLHLKEEDEFSKAFSEANALKRKLMTASRALNQLESEETQSKEVLDNVLQQNIELGRQLKNIPTTNVQLYGSVVGEMNATVSELHRMQAAQKDSQKQLDESRQAMNSARERYVQKIFQVRELAGRVTARYAELSHDAEAGSLLEEWNASLKKPLKLEPSRAFQASVKRLEGLEKTVVTDKIPLRRVGGSLMATVVINGEHVHDMVVDTGATLMLLPYAVAVKFGLNLDKARNGKAQIADGSIVDAKYIKLDSVRIGKFTARNVECGISPPQATRAPLLLGMSFLGKFNVQLNGSELVFSKVDSEPSVTKRKPTSKKHADKKKNAAKAPIEP